MLIILYSSAVKRRTSPSEQTHALPYNHSAPHVYPAGVALRDSQSTKQTGYLCLTATLLRKTFKLFLNVNLQSAKHVTETYCM